MFEFMKASGKKEADLREQNAKFAIALQEVDDLSNRAKAHKSIETVPERGKFFKIGAHKVTGKELNVAAGHIDESIIQVKNVQIETLRHIEQLYRVLDTLDGEYVSGILEATEAAEMAKNLASINDENIGKIVRYLSQDDRVRAYKTEQESRMATLESKIKTAYILAGSSAIVALVSLVFCLVILF